MSNQTHNPKSASPRLYASGTIRVFLTQNISRHKELQESHRESFQVLRGSKEFKEAVVGLSQYSRPKNPSAKFAFDSETHNLVERGYETRVFNQYLIEEEFMPTYRYELGGVPSVELDRDFDILKDTNIYETIRGNLNSKVEAEWRNWKRPKVRFSRYGLFQVILEHRFRHCSIPGILGVTLGLENEIDIEAALETRLGELAKEPPANRHHYNSILRLIRGRVPQAWWKSITNLFPSPDSEEEKIRRLLDNRAASRYAIDPSVQWELFRALKLAFYDQWNGKLKVKNQTLDFSGKEIDYRTSKSYPLRFRYVSFDLEKLYRNIDGHLEPINSVADLDDDDMRELASLLEMVPIEKGDSVNGKDLELGNYKLDRAKRLIESDHSSWEEELYIATHDCVLIFRGLDPKMHFRHPVRIRYKDYWLSIQRGIEYLCELRVLAKFLAHATTKELNDVNKHFSGKLRLKGIHRIGTDLSYLPQVISNYTRLSASLNFASLPTIMSTAEYSLEKFEEMSRLYDMPSYCNHIGNNIRALNEFLKRYDDILLQNTIQRTSLFLAFIAIFVGVTLNSLPRLPLVANKYSISIPTFFVGVGRAMQDLFGMAQGNVAYDDALITVIGMLILLIVASLIFVYIYLHNFGFPRIRRRAGLSPHEYD